MTDAATRPQRVFYVDDDPAVLELALTLLRDGGFDVAGTTDPDEALRRMRDEEWDVVLLDVIMPRMSGAALFERVEKERPDLARHVGFVTVLGATPEFFPFAEGKQIPVLAKPFTAESLITFVRSRLAPS